MINVLTKANRGESLEYTLSIFTWVSSTPVISVSIRLLSNISLRNIYRLYVHSRIKKIKNHSRDQCEFQSVNSSDLKRHINFVHLKIKYSCNQCEPKATTQNSSLLVHTKSVQKPSILLSSIHTTGKNLDVYHI